jgi:hypothetical protein
LVASFANADQSNSSGRLPEDEPLPLANNTIHVSNQGQLLGAVSRAAPRDHIVLQNGRYGNVTLYRDFPKDKRLVIRAANLLRAKFTRITVDGDGYIISGVDVTQDSTGSGTRNVRITGNNVRLTRCNLKNGYSNVVIGPYDSKGPTVEDTLVDHCTLSNYVWRSVYLAQDRKNSVRRPIVARNWFHHGLDTGEGPLLSTIAFGSENAYREDPVNGIVRFNYFGPTLERGDHIHNKTSGNIYAFNKTDQTAAARGNKLFNNRFGTDTMFIGNYIADQKIVLYDYDQWVFGNLAAAIGARGGNSDLYDEDSNAIYWNGVKGATSIFGASQRTRIAGNMAPINVGWHDAKFCDHDPQPSGLVKPRSKNSVSGEVYDIDNPNDPNNGVHIYDNSQAPKDWPNQCRFNFDWHINTVNRWQRKAPSSWNNELPAWITAVVADPTDRSAQPWKIAEGLTRGDAYNPTTGPSRNSPGGLLQR